jgi:hypothetical protein
MKVYGIFSLSEDIRQKYLESHFDGVEVDLEKKILKIEYLYDKKTREIKRNLKIDNLGEPNYFQISIKIPEKIVVVGLTEKCFFSPIVNKEGKFLLINKEATAVEYFNSRLRATYFSTFKKENKNFLISYLRYEIKIPYFLNSQEDKENFLNANLIPLDIKSAFDKIAYHLNFEKENQELDPNDAMAWI